MAIADSIPCCAAHCHTTRHISNRAWASFKWKFCFPTRLVIGPRKEHRPVGCRYEGAVVRVFDHHARTSCISNPNKISILERQNTMLAGGLYSIQRLIRFLGIGLNLHGFCVVGSALFGCSADFCLILMLGRFFLSVGHVLVVMLIRSFWVKNAQTCASQDLNETMRFAVVWAMTTAVNFKADPCFCWRCSVAS